MSSATDLPSNSAIGPIPTMTLTATPSPMLSVAKSTSYHLPTSCLDNIYTLAPDGFDTLQSAKVTGGLDPACFPVGPLPDPDMTTIYFPVPCHTGYEAVRAAVLPSAGITVNTCCPSGFDYASDTFAGYCMDYNLSVDIPVTIVNGTSTTSTNIAGRVAKAITVAWQNNATSSNIAHSYSSLSSGAQAGVGLGVSVFVLAVAAIFGVLAWRRKHRKISATRLEEVKSLDAAMTREEMPDTEIHEASGHIKPHEVDENNYRVELPAEWHGWEMSTPVKDNSASTQSEH